MTPIKLINVLRGNYSLGTVATWLNPHRNTNSQTEFLCSAQLILKLKRSDAVSVGVDDTGTVMVYTHVRADITNVLNGDISTSPVTLNWSHVILYLKNGTLNLLSMLERGT